MWHPPADNFPGSHHMFLESQQGQIRLLWGGSMLPANCPQTADVPHNVPDILTSHGGDVSTLETLHSDALVFGQALCFVP